MGFWSYVHRDDDADMGRVAQLARDIVEGYEALTAEKIQLFLDRDDMHWGDLWRDRVDDALSNVAFFIPVITPRYFKSAECRREFQFFYERADRLGITKLVMPILYIDVKQLRVEGSADDPIMKLIKEVHWEEWTPFRMKERESEAYRTAVDHLANELVGRVAAVESVDIVPADDGAKAETADEDEESPGTIDRLATMELSTTEWGNTITDINAEVSEIGALMMAGTADIARAEQQGKGFAGRLMVAKRLAQELGAPVGRIEALSKKFLAELVAIDDGIRLLIEQMTVEYAQDVDSQPQICKFLNVLRGLSESVKEGLGSMQGLVSASRGLESLSKDMRPPLRRLGNALTPLVEATDITDGWVKLIDAGDFACGS